MDESFKEKIQSVNFGNNKVRGKPEVKVVPHEKDGKPAGQYTEHPDGRIDCSVFPRTGHTIARPLQPGGSSG
jgi:hypothetical protein